MSEHPKQPDPLTPLNLGRRPPPRGLGGELALQGKTSPRPGLAPHLEKLLDQHVGHVRRGDASELIADWLKGRSISTLDAYNRALRLFAGFLSTEELELAPAEAVQMLLACTAPEANTLVLRFRQHLEERFAPGTVAVHISGLRSLVAFAHRLGLVAFQLGVKTEEAVPYRDTAGPDPEAIKCLLKHIQAAPPVKRARDLAILSLLYLHALRQFEVRGLDLHHLDRVNKRLWVLGKQRKERVAVPLGQRALANLLAWLEVRDAPESEKAMFVSLQGGRLSHEGVRLVFQGYAKAVSADLGRPVAFRPHGFRHAAITRYAERESNPFKVMAFSRHKSPQTVMIYIDRVLASPREHSDFLAEDLFQFPDAPA